MYIPQKIFKISYQIIFFDKIENINLKEFNGIQRINIMGNWLNGVSINDLIANSKQMAMRFYN